MTVLDRPPARRGVAALGAAIAIAVTGLCAVPAAAETGLPAQTTPTAGPVPAGLRAWYPLDEIGGSTAADRLGGPGGTLVAPAGGTFTGGQGLSLAGTGSYLDLPDDLTAGLSAITVSVDVRIDPRQSGAYFVYGLGNRVGNEGRGYLFTTGNAYRTAISLANYCCEQSVGAGRDLPRGVWKHLTYTLADGTAVLYLDGVEVERRTGVTVTPGQIGGGRTVDNRLGGSLYVPDRSLHGSLRDFAVYDRALTPAEVASNAARTTAEIVAGDRVALTPGATGALTADLTLPATAPGGSAVTWATSNAAVVTNTGRITRPASGTPAAGATLTATLRLGASTATVAFAVTVAPWPTDREATEAAAAAIDVPNLAEPRGHLTLPTSGPDGTAIAWRSSRDRVITTTGEVTRPEPGAKAVKVVLTATVTRGQFRTVRTMTAQVPPRPAPSVYTGYAFAYFTGEGSADGEQIYFSASVGDDPLHWRDVNGAQPVLRSVLGERGVRDPFLIRSPEGDRFYLIATDLKINGNGNWDRAQRDGSRSIMVWESADLVHWSAQRSVQVSPPNAGNTWAPEAFYDTARGEYVVYWASKLYPDATRTGDTYNRVVAATTRDFHSFTPARPYIDRGYSVIDTTIIADRGSIYRFSKDERNNTSSTPNSKFILLERGDSVLDPTFELVREGIGRGQIGAGEGPTVFKSNTEEKWYLFIDEFGGRGYVPFETTDLGSGEFTVSADYALPRSPRHGTVIPVTAAEHAALSALTPG